MNHDRLYELWKQAKAEHPYSVNNRINRYTQLIQEVENMNSKIVRARAKAVPVEFMQYTGDNIFDIAEFSEDRHGTRRIRWTTTQMPDSDAYDSGRLVPNNVVVRSVVNGYANGPQDMKPGDWLGRGADELQVVTADAFENAFDILP